MGGVISSPLVSLTAVEVADYIASIDLAYEEYRELFIANGTLDGNKIATWQDEIDAIIFLSIELGISNKNHIRRLVNALRIFQRSLHRPPHPPTSEQEELGSTMVQLSLARVDGQDSQESPQFLGRAMSGGPEKLFECSICLSPMNDPVTLPCGHSACKEPCLDRWFESKDKCPVCRAIVPERIRRDLHVAINMKDLINKAYPGLGAEREAQKVEEAARQRAAEVERVRETVDDRDDDKIKQQKLIQEVLSIMSVLSGCTTTHTAK